MAVVTTNLGVVTAYGDAVEGGYTGTKEQWQALMADYGTIGTQAQADAQTASTAAQTATTKASEASASATQAVNAKTAAETAQEAAEDAAESVSASAAQIAQNTSDIASVKEGLNAVFIADSASGSTARFVDGADNVAMKSVKVNIAPVQSGSGDPSPDNVRPITGFDVVKVYHSGENTEEATEYDISLSSAGTVYGGTLDAVSGELTVTTELYSVTEVSGTATSGNVRRFFTTKNKPSATAVVCNSLKLGGQSDLNAVFVNDEGRIVMTPDWAQSMTTAEEFNSALASHPINLVITLATPLTYQLSATEVKSLLGINNVWSDAGDMDVKYRADTKLYIDKRLGV